MTYAEALNLAMDHAMAEDPNVFAFGVDIDDHKRTFGSGRGLVEKYGARRYFSTPVSEAACTGIAVGAAMSGLRPVQIHARADFMLLAMNQLVNMASTHAYLSNGRDGLPMTVRSVIGRSWGQGPQHSKAMHGTLGHFPGLKIVMPVTPQDAYSQLRGAIEDPNPVIVFEHRWLYDTTGYVDTRVKQNINECRIVREGASLTIAACSWMVVEALQAADILAEYGYQAEVIDLRTTDPSNMGVIYESACKTGRLVVADNDWLACGFGADIVARVAMICFDELEAGPLLVGFAPSPCPTTRPLENMFYPTAQDIVWAACHTLNRQIDTSGYTFNEYENRFKGPF
jgi:acetoin:2,6-dichlorophenolindophenol oxidoreductase subunit beta